MESGYELLRDKTAIITGCNRGIGKAILEAFAANGANIFACTRKENTVFLKYIDHLSKKYAVHVTPIYFEAANI